MVFGRSWRSPQDRSGVPATGSVGTFKTRKARNQEAWYRERAQEQFTRCLRAWSDWCRLRNLPQPKLALHTMPKRWGSAHRDGTIALTAC
jgi:predicted metal-dependent hydrolase